MSRAPSPSSRCTPIRTRLEASTAGTTLPSHTLNSSTIHVLVLGLDFAARPHDAVSTSVSANRVQTTLHRPRQTHREVVRRQLPLQEINTEYDVGKETVTHELLELMGGVHRHLVDLLLLLHSLLREDRQRVRQRGTGGELREGERNLRQLHVRRLSVITPTQLYQLHLVDAIRQLRRIRDDASLHEKEKKDKHRDDTVRSIHAGRSSPDRKRTG